ncbi:esterase-like activity of phytase family protein [Stenotrophobium rhamnosiphilum]|uniref:Phytase-like domain-containing protein n=1 Tax=Stenotrophobium rhamnosiphilum TaxID=2029166 RepID=A0A2T5MGQ1_9GAMM|nr:esterase-like activity of phytase family protein [Stenotrophobium rhamnosiphilum]PTU31765.1 hypothetical protein CJD38_10740 [Stenotrophobium rhamnosiphilum]
MRLSSRAIISLTLLATLAGCSGTSKNTGVLIDSKVIGLEYSTVALPNVRVTDEEGNFTYYGENDTVTFRIGGITLGSAPATSKIPLTALVSGGDALPDTVINRARFLQTLDSDNDPSNGITIDSATRAALVGKSLRFDANFAADFAALNTGKTLRSAAVSREHLEASLAAEFGRSNTSTVNVAGIGDIQITKLLIDDSGANYHVPYSGKDSLNADTFGKELATAYPKGLPFAFGSGIRYKGSNADGSMDFWYTGDRGPNGDSPDAPDNTSGSASTLKSKVFLVPSFNPAFGVVRVKDGVATPLSKIALHDESNVLLTGLPIAAGSPAPKADVPLTDKLDQLPFVASGTYGLDPEGIDTDSNGNLWMSDEYGPFMFKVNPANGQVLQRLYPGSGLPAVLANRQLNRGLEGIAVTPNGKIYGLMQSVLDLPTSGTKPKDTGSLLRIVEIDPVNNTTKMFAYFHDYDDDTPANSIYSKSNDAKMGDLIALDNTRFLVIEQGAFKNDSGNVHNVVYLIDISGATDLYAGNTDLLVSGKLPEYTKSRKALTCATATTPIVPIRKLKLFDLKQPSPSFNWLAEKAEGLAVLPDGKTIVISNDNDFGLSARTEDSATPVNKLKGDDCVIDASKTILTNKGGCDLSKNAALVAPFKYIIGAGKTDERPSRLWFFKMPNALSTLTVPAFTAPACGP